MSLSTTSLRGSSSPKLAQEAADVAEEPEPDTPVHHTRGTARPSYRQKLLRWARLVFISLLFLAATSWLFLDVGNQHGLTRNSWSRSGQTRFLLPDGHLVNNRLLDKRVEVETVSSEYGLEPLEEHAEEHFHFQSARERWMDTLPPLTVQPLSADVISVNKSLSIILLLPSCCGAVEQSERQAAECSTHIMANCAALGSSQCFQQAASQNPCQNLATMKDHKMTYFSGLQRLVPMLAELGWSGIQIHQLPQLAKEASRNTSCQVSSAQQQAAESALANARVIICDAKDLPALSQAYTTAAFVAVEPSDSATLPVRLTQQSPALVDNRVRGIWKAQTLDNPDFHNGPLLAGFSHLAYLPGAHMSSHFAQFRSPTLPAIILPRIQPVLSHAFRYRYPLDCGGNLEHLRFAGAFQQNFSHWQPPRLSKRKVDVAFIGQTHFGSRGKARRAEMDMIEHHKQTMLQQLRIFEKRHPRFIVQLHRKRALSYADYLQQLQDVKILVSPLGAAEWAEQDFIAILCGCLLLKVNPAAYLVHPDVFRPRKNVLAISGAWEGLEKLLFGALHDDPEHSQRIADRAYMLLLEHSDLRRYAALIDQHLSHLVRNL